MSPVPPSPRGPHRAYYYYETEANKNYEQTMLDIAAYAAQESIPYRWLLLDRCGSFFITAHVLHGALSLDNAKAPRT